MYSLPPLYACFHIWFLSRDVTMTSLTTTPLQIIKIRHIIASVYQKSFGIVYIGAVYVFLFSHPVNLTFVEIIWTLFR